MSAYQYRPLSQTSNGFRLLRLLRRRKLGIECELYHTTTSHEVHTYEALSYSWGSNDLVESIEVDQQRLWVTDSLHTALSCLRLPYQDRILWVDSVCINQNDDIEKSQQVQFMADIYSNADRVLFWLGKATLEVSCLFDVLDGFSRHVERKTMGTNWSFEEQRLVTLWEEYIPEDSSMILLQSCKKGLLTLLRRQWFERVWILQEVAKARRAIVCSGMQSITAHVFALAPRLLNIAVQHHCQSVLDIVPGPPKYNSSWWSEKRDLFTLMQRFSNNKATDERDKAYALLGIVESDNFEGINADYTLCLTDVVHLVIKHLLESSAATATDILDILEQFRSLRTIYFIPYSEKQVETRRGLGRSAGARRKAMEVAMQDPSLNKDPSLFFLEQHNDNGLSSSESPYRQVTQLSLGSSHERDDGDSLPGEGYFVRPWGDRSRSVTVLAIENWQDTLVTAALGGSQQVIRIILSQSERLQVTEHSLQDALLSAIDHRPVHVAKQAVELLLSEGVIATTSFLDENMSHVCASDAGEPLLRLALQRGLDINNVRGMDPPLTEACILGSMQIMTTLLDNGAKVNARSLDGWSTALRAALRQSRIDPLKLLLARGADANETYEAGLPALHFALYTLYDLNKPVEAQALAIIEALLEFGADPNTSVDTYGTAIFAAMQVRDIDLGRLLIKHGADLEILDPHGWSMELLCRMANVGDSWEDEILKQTGTGVLSCQCIGPTRLHAANSVSRIDYVNDVYQLQPSKRHVLSLFMADHPLPADTAVAYFEIKIHELDADTEIYVGLRPFQMQKCTHESQRYREGWAYHNARQGSRPKPEWSHVWVGPPYGVKDTVGYGIDYVKREQFYTLNGAKIGFGRGIPPGQLFPALGVQPGSVKLRVNFGERPFLYEIHGSTGLSLSRLRGKVCGIFAG